MGEAALAMDDSWFSPQFAREAFWHAGILRYKLRPQQLQIYDTIKALPHDVSTVVLLCARQFGKSVLGVLLAVEDCLQNPDVVVVIIAPKVDQAASIVRPRMKLLMRDMPDGLIKERKGENTWYFHNGSELKLGGYGTGAVSQRGKTLYKVYLEEFGPDADPDRYSDFIQSDIQPTMTNSAHAQIFYLTTPPKIPDHPFVTETIPEAALNGAFFRFTIDDNTYLSQARKDKIARDLGGRHTVAFRREYLCEIVRDDSIVLVPEFDDTRHVCEFDVPVYCHHWIGGDTGGVQDRTVFLLLGYDFERGKVLVIDERDFAPETSTKTYVDEASRMEDGRRVKGRWVDAPGQLRVDLSTFYKWPVIQPDQHELEPTVNLVRLAFTKDLIEVHPRCKMLIETLRSGHYNQKRTDLARTRALGHMDAFMALAYGLRHAVKSNPFPDFHGLHSESHHIPDHIKAKRKTIAAALRPKLTR